MAQPIYWVLDVVYNQTNAIYIFEVKLVMEYMTKMASKVRIAFLKVEVMSKGSHQQAKYTNRNRGN